MTHGITPSEKFVSSLCERSFLRLWTHPNPKGKKNKELCDCLVVCGPHIIIISVKESVYKDTGDITGWGRWEKSAIENTANQIWGAERWLETTDQFVRHDGRVISLPAKADRKYHRISVSMGGRGHIPIKWGDLGNGFIHVCDEYSVGVVFSALDTITDFVDFLNESEALVNNGTLMIFAGGGIEDLLAYYLMNGRSFDSLIESGKRPGMVIMQDDLWKGFYKSNDFKAIQDEFKESYIWDRLIAIYTDDLLTDGMFDMHSKNVTHNELALVTMALQTRAYRAPLADAFIEIFNNPELKVASRAVKGYADTAFVFLIGKSSYREHRARELALRCLVIRGRFPGVKTVVGIATDRPGTSEIGYSSEIVYIHRPKWTTDDEKQVVGIQDDLGYFQNADWSKR